MYNPITILKIKEVTLTVIYDKSYCGLHNYFSSDDRMCQFLKSNTDEAYLHSINKVDVDSYLLNIASTINLGAFEWKNEKELLNKQLSMFTPIINKFIVTVLTNTLENNT
jgi:hypothetical protein